ncbi:MAG: hypothetical protein LAT63_07350 [Marinobacter sp.]|nr:hypothetical protein [Marinobacter sp.]
MFRQRGAMLITLPLMLVALFAITIVIVDASRLYGLRKEMQSQVNAAASAGADVTQACVGDSVSLAAIQARALMAAQAQGFTGDASLLDIRGGVFEIDPADSLRVGFRTLTGDALNQSNAVRVSYSQDVPISRLMPGLLGSLNLSVSAAARKEVVAVLSAAGSTVAIDQGLLGLLLGTILADPGFILDPTDINSLQAVTVRVGNLLNRLGVNDAVDLLPLPLDRFLEAVLQDIGGTAAPGGYLVDRVLSGAFGVVDLSVGDILMVVGDSRVPPGSEFPVYDLLMSTIINSIRELGNQTGGILQVGLSSSETQALLGNALAGLGLLAEAPRIDVGIRVGEAPRVVVGPARRGPDGQWITRFSAPDIGLDAYAQVRLNTGAVTSIINTLSLGTLQVQVLDDLEIPLAVRVGGGQGSLVSARCARGIDNDIALELALQREVASVMTGRVDGPTGNLIAQGIFSRIFDISLREPILGTTLLRADLCVDAALSGVVPGQNLSTQVGFNTSEPYPLFCSMDSGCERREFDIPAAPSFGSGVALNLDRFSLSCGGAISSLLSSVIAALIAPVNQLVVGVTEAILLGLLNPLLAALGIELGTLSVAVTSANQQGTQLVESVVLVD